MFYATTNIAFHPQINVFWLLYSLIGLLLFCFGIYAGIETVNLKPIGITLSVYLQLLQVVSFSILGFTYMFNTGYGVFLGIDMASSLENFARIAPVKFGMGKADDNVWQITINIIPLAILLLLEMLYRKTPNPLRLTRLCKIVAEVLNSPVNL